ncbi:MAG: DMT family transporter [Clostridia bacterium]|nr:DMT family transporter [Clostridia bacterium]
MQNQQLKGTVYILIATVIWGSCFVAQSASTIGPFTYQGIRSIIGCLFLVVLSLVLDFFAKRKGSDAAVTKWTDKTLLTGGLVCGVVLFGATNLQQFGIFYGTEPGKAGFITAMYILLVPVIGLFMKKKVRYNVWIGIAVAVVGLLLLCVNPAKGMGFQYGDIYVILCAVVFSFHIVFVDYYAPKVDGVKLSCVQFLVSGGISCICMLLFEEPKIGEIVDNTVPILYAGIGSSGIAYTLQIIGQKYSPPTIASLAMSFESVFAVLSEIVVSFFIYLVGKGPLSLPTVRELIGCAVMFAAILLAQLPEKKK